MTSTDTAGAGPGCIAGRHMGQFEQAYHVQDRWLQDIYALGALQPLLKDSYLPFTSSSLRPARLAFVLNEIVINERRSILEFGAGVSTIMIGRLIKANRMNTRLIAIEHIGDWAAILSRMLEAEGLDRIVSVVHAPLVAYPSADHSDDWYDTALLERTLGEQTFDMVLVDGPPAFEAAKKKARYPALPFVYRMLARQFSLFLDDADREGERLVLGRWTEDYSLIFQQVAGSLAYCCADNNHQAFNPRL
jgi:predicted O-methyltransferase YrrM